MSARPGGSEGVLDPPRHDSFERYAAGAGRKGLGAAADHLFASGWWSDLARDHRVRDKYLGYESV